MDVNIDESVNNAIDEMEKAAKQINGRGIDVLINNAGISFFKSVEDLSMDDWHTTFNTNFFGTLRVVRAIVPFMRERMTGQIINTSTLGVIGPIPFQSHYTASKAAIKVFTEILRVELKQFNIKVSTIIPSDINTDFNVNMLDLSIAKSNDLTSTDIDTMLNNIPTDSESPYYDLVKRVWQKVVRNLIVSPPPLVISKKLVKIIKSRRPKINYKAGSFEQKFLTFLIRRVVTDEFTYWLLPKYFDM
jgi:short-subunit dehydrogenase